MFFNKKGSGPSFNIGDIMKAVTPLMLPGGDKKKAVANLVTTFATDDNIKFAASATIAGMEALQKDKGLKFVLSIETAMQDIAISIYTRSEDMALHPYRQFFVSQLTQSDFIALINIIFNDVHTTNGQQQLTAGNG